MKDVSEKISNLILEADENTRPSIGIEFYCWKKIIVSVLNSSLYPINFDIESASNSVLSIKENKFLKALDKGL